MTATAQRFNPNTSRFDGAGYDARRDNQRLASQLERVFDVMRDGKYRSLDRIAREANAPAASVSAQLRHLRKPRFGGHTVNKSYQGDGLYLYQLIVNTEREPVQAELLPVVG